MLHQPLPNSVIEEITYAKNILENPGLAEKITNFELRMAMANFFTNQEILFSLISTPVVMTRELYQSDVK